MNDLVVLAFDSPQGAENKVAELDRMQKMQIIRLDDAAVVTRDMDGKTKVKQSQSLVGAGAFGGAFWGMLIGLLFWMPWLGLAIGAISGALSGKFADIGIDDKFIQEVGSTIKPGQSALFIMVRDATPDKVLEELRGWNGVTVMRTSLSNEAEEKLREALATSPREETARAS